MHKVAVEVEWMKDATQRTGSNVAIQIKMSILAFYLSLSLSLSLFARSLARSLVYIRSLFLVTCLAFCHADVVGVL